MRAEMESPVHSPDLHGSHSVLQCQQDVVVVRGEMEKLKQRSEGLTKELKETRSKVVTLQKEKIVLTNRLGDELAAEHSGAGA